MARISYCEALSLALREEMDRDPCVFIMGEKVGYVGGAFKVTDGLLAAYGERRVRDTPISELATVGGGIGAAIGGLRPVVELPADAAFLALDLIINHAAKIRHRSGGKLTVPIVIRIPHGAGHQFDGKDGQTLEAHFLHCPGLRVVIPATPADAKGMLKTALRQDDPVIFMEHHSLYNLEGEVPDGELLVPFGKATVLREGKDLTIVTYSKCGHDSMDAGATLQNEGIDAEVIDLRTLNPLDIGTVIESVKKTGKAMVVHEGWKTGGVGAEIAAQIYQHAFEHLDAPIARVTTLPSDLRSANAATIVAAVKRVMGPVHHLV